MRDSIDDVIEDIKKFEEEYRDGTKRLRKWNSLLGVMEEQEKYRR